MPVSERQSVRVPLLDLRRERAALRGELDAAIATTLAEMRLLGGEQVRAFEAEMARHLGVAHVAGVASGTAALLLGLAAAGVAAGDRVILPANAFVAALEAVLWLGARPILVDAQADGFAPDVAQIEAALPARAVLVVHLYGAAYDLTPLRALCAHAGAALVEDGSHSPGARRGGRAVGSFGDVGCFSAGVVKNLAAYGDAGFVSTQSAAIDAHIRLLRHHGQVEKNLHSRLGFNHRLDELQAAVLRVKLRHLEARNQRRRAIAARYSDAFAALPVQVPEAAADEEPIFHQYVLRSDARDHLRTHLAARGIETGIHYPTPLHRQPVWEQRYGRHPALPRAEGLAKRILSLPIFPEMAEEEVARVIAATREFFARIRRRPATISTRHATT